MSIPYLSAPYYKALLAEARGETSFATTEALCDALMPPLPDLAWRGGRGLAILFDESDPFSPTDSRSNAHILELARGGGLAAEIIGPDAIETLAGFDALWIRTVTAPMKIAYRFARMAERLGMPVIDDSASIRTCGNKAFLAERLAARGVPVPRTLLVRQETTFRDIERAIPYPVILKMPDGTFSSEVYKANDNADLLRLLRLMRQRSHIVVAQEFVPTSFDWRVTLLDGEVLFACKYGMAEGHWQILKHDGKGTAHEGGFVPVPVAEAPADILQVARRAASAIGRGLYGVDIKATSRGIVVIEVNDNPDIKLGIEDLAEGDGPWLRILAWFGVRMMRRRFIEAPSRIDLLRRSTG